MPSREGLEQLSVAEVHWSAGTMTMSVVLSEWTKPPEMVQGTSR